MIGRRRRRRQRLHVMNFHPIPSAERAKLPNHTRRLRHYLAYVAGIAHVLSTRIGSRVLAGDANARPGFAGLARIVAAGMREVIHRPTHGARTLDHLYVSADLDVIHTDVLEVPSDHRAALAWIGRRGRWTHPMATYNLGNRPDRDVVKGLNAVALAGAHVICCQEAGDRAGALAAFLADPVVGEWRTSTAFGEVDRIAGAPSLPILWRLDQLGMPAVATARVIVPRTYLGRPGAGPDWAKAKALVRLRFDRP